MKREKVGSGNVRGILSIYKEKRKKTPKLCSVHNDTFASTSFIYIFTPFYYFYPPCYGCGRGQRKKKRRYKFKGPTENIFWAFQKAAFCTCACFWSLRFVVEKWTHSHMLKNDSQFPKHCYGSAEQWRQKEQHH